MFLVITPAFNIMGTVLFIIVWCQSHCSEVLFFHVHDVKPLLSDHTLITTKLYVNYIPENENSKPKRIDMPQSCLEYRLTIPVSQSLVLQLC